MIPADLLSALREADPELWDTFLDEKPFYPKNDLEIDKTGEWILQGMLQERIRARGWGYAIGRSSKGMTSASVYAQEGEGKTVMGYDEAEDLLRAYLSARSREAEDKA